MDAFHISGAQILRDGQVAGGDFGVTGGVLAEGRPGRRIDLPGTLILPGIVDPHGDGFERHLAPRRGAFTDLSDGLAMLAAELAVNGITTAMLAQFYSWEGGMRGPDFAARMLAAHAEVAPTLTLDLRVQLRLETHLTDHFDAVLDLVRRYGIGFLVFNDHLPHDALEAGKRPPRLTGQALKSGRSPEAHHGFLKELHERKDQVPEAVERLISALPEGVILGSHDDHTAEDRRIWRARDASLSEFPETTEASEEAVRFCESVIMGAPNVVRGGSHAGKVSAEEIIAAGHCSALASDYHYPAPRQAAWKLSHRIGLPAAWKLVSEGPAKVLRLDDRGRLQPGLRADFIVMDPASGRPLATFAGGRPAWMGPEVAQAVLTA